MGSDLFGGPDRSRPGGDSRSLVIALLAALAIAAATIAVVTVAVTPDGSAGVVEQVD